MHRRPQPRCVPVRAPSGESSSPRRAVHRLHRRRLPRLPKGVRNILFASLPVSQDSFFRSVGCQACCCRSAVNRLPKNQTCCRLIWVCIPHWKTNSSENATVVQGTCKRGELCPFAHGVFEAWLHPARYRTQLCRDGSACERPSASSRTGSRHVLYHCGTSGWRQSQRLPATVPCTSRQQ